MKPNIVIMFVLLLFPCLALGDMGDYVKDYLGKMEQNNTAIFYSRCESKVKDQYKATLLFEIGSKKGLLIESKNNVVINLATVKIGAKGLIIEETHGGIYTYERIKKLANELAKYKFSFLSPVEIKKMESVRPLYKCENIPE